MEAQDLERQCMEAMKSLQDVCEQLKTTLTTINEQLAVEDVVATPIDVTPVEGAPAETPAPKENVPAEAAPKDEVVTQLGERVEEMRKANEMILGLLESQNLELDEMKKNQAERIQQLEDKNDEKQERLEKIIQTVQEDRYRKDKLKLIKRCVFQADLIRKLLKCDYPEVSKDMSPEEREAFLLKQMESVVTGMESMLLDEGVEVVHFAKEGEKVQSEFQEVVGTRPTDDPEKDGTVAESINPGYVWTLPYILKAKLNESGDEIKHYRFLMQSEQVVAYKIKN